MCLAKQILNVVLVTALLVSASGCPKEIATDKLVLSFSFWGSYLDLEMWRQITAKFEEENPDVQFKLEYTAGDYAQKLVLRLISNTASDVILMDDESFPGYSERGYLVDLAEWVERDGAELRNHDFLPTALDSFNFRGVQGGLPWGGFPVLMFYNKDMFDAAGVPYPQPDWTWNDFRDIAKRLTRDTDGNGAPDEFGANVGFGFLDMEPVIWSFGGDILNEDCTRAVINSPEALDALKLIYDIKFVDHSTAWSGESEGMAKEVELLTGNVGMVMSGWYLAQELMSIKGGMRWGIAPIPRGPQGHRYTRVSWDGISINNSISPEKKEAAWRFLKFVLREDNQAYICSSGRNLPVHRSDAQAHFVRPDTPAEEELALEAVDYGKLTPVTAKYEELKGAVQRPFKKVEIQKMTPDEAIAEAEKGANEVLAKELARWSKDSVPAVDYTSAKRGFQIFFGALGALVLFLLYVSRKRIADGLRYARKEYRSSMARIEAFHGVLFALPWMCGFVIFMAFPFAFSIVLSLSKWDPYDPLDARTFVGLDNFKRALLDDPLVWKALWNTFYFAAFAVPLGLFLSLGLAMLLNQKVWGVRIYRTIFYIPSIVGGVATAVIWTYIFNPTYGPLTNLIRIANGVLAHVTAYQIPEIQWLADPLWAKPSLVLMSLWGAGGGGMLIFLAGLQGISDHYYEAADLDGAGRFRKFWNITLPMLSPTIYFNLIMGLIAGLQVFMEAFVMAGKDGGVDNALLFYVLYLYRKAFIEYDMGYASALAWILFVVILTFTLFVVRGSALWVYYEGEKKR